jgi:hypothetical protein
MIFNVGMVTGKLVSLMWPTRDISAGESLVRPHATKISLMQLGKQIYWATRYEEEEEFDWYCSYSHVRDLILRHVDLSHSVLVAGTGASSLPIQMELDG